MSKEDFEILLSKEYNLQFLPNNDRYDIIIGTYLDFFIRDNRYGIITITLNQKTESRFETQYNIEYLDYYYFNDNVFKSINESDFRDKKINDLLSSGS
jgi:hypothetical protein